MTCQRRNHALVLLASILAPLGCGSSSDASGTSSKPSQATSVVDGGVEAGRGAATAGVPTLFYLDLLGGRVLRVGTDGASPDAIVTTGNAEPDGVAVDVPGGHVYWTNMGVPQGIT